MFRSCCLLLVLPASGGINQIVPTFAPSVSLLLFRCCAIKSEKHHSFLAVVFGCCLSVKPDFDLVGCKYPAALRVRHLLTRQHQMCDYVAPQRHAIFGFHCKNHESRRHFAEWTHFHYRCGF